jgi:hypothetical protein
VRRFRALTLSLAIVTSACASCRRGAGTTGSNPDAVSAVESAVPAPAGLLAEAWLRAPDDAWARLQRGAGGALSLLPSTTGQLACAVSGLDPELAPLVDGGATSYVVLADRAAGTDVAWALALPLRDGARAASLLVSADVSRYTTRTEGSLRIVSRVDAPLPTAVALVPGDRWLLVARDEAALLALGPYVYRTLPTKPPPPSSSFAVAVAPQSALSGPISASLLSRWLAVRGSLAASDDQERTTHGGRAPDYADPRAILDVADAAIRGPLTFLSQAQTARLELDVAEDRVRADVTVVPGEGQAAAKSLVESMRPGDALPLARAPSGSVLAVLLRDDAAARAAGAHDLAATLAQVLGDRLKREDDRAMQAALADWARGRGDWVMVALPWGERRGLFVRTPAAEREAAVRAVREIVGVSQRPPFGDLVGKALSIGPASFGAADVPSFGRATLATFSSSRAGEPKAPPFGVAWGVREGDLFVVAGEDATRSLAEESSPTPALGDDPVVGRALADLGSDAAFAAVVQPLRLHPERAPGGSAPAIVVLGRRGGNLWVRVEISDTLVRELVRLGAGL